MFFYCFVLFKFINKNNTPPISASMLSIPFFFHKVFDFQFTNDEHLPLKLVALLESFINAKFSTKEKKGSKNCYFKAMTI